MQIKPNYLIIVSTKVLSKKGLNFLKLIHSHAVEELHDTFK